MPIPRQVMIDGSVSANLFIESQLPRTVREKVTFVITSDAFRLHRKVVVKDGKGNVYATPVGEDLCLPDTFIADLCVRVD